MYAIFPIFLRAMVMGVVVYILKYIVTADLALLLVGMVIGIISYGGITLLTGSSETTYLLSTITRLK